MTPVGIRQFIPLGLICLLGCHSLTKNTQQKAATSVDVSQERAVGISLTIRPMRIPAPVIANVQSLCLRLVGESCFFVNTNEIVALMVPGEGFFISRGLLRLMPLEVDFRAFLTFESERRLARLPLDLQSADSGSILQGEFPCRTASIAIGDGISRIIDRTMDRAGRNSFDGRSLSGIIERVASNSTCRTIAYLKSPLHEDAKNSLRVLRTRFDSSIQVTTEYYRHFYRLIFPQESLPTSYLENKPQ